MSAGNGMSADPQKARPLPPVAEMSSHQRSALLEAIHAQIVALTLANNQLTKRVVDAERAIDNLNERTANTYADVRAVENEHDAFIAFVGRSFMARLRWLLTGR